ncbi:CPBP family intramembrane metalloprotease [bacterium]|nr:CPBP family intramembrane metalloprotease [bacterium]
MTRGPARLDPLRMMKSTHNPAMERIGPKARRVLWLIAKLTAFIAVVIALRAIWAAVGWGDAGAPPSFRAAASLGVLFPLLFILFRRDVRLLARYLGTAKKPAASVLTIIVVFVIEIALLINVAIAFYFLVPRGLSAPTPETGEFIMKNIVQPIIVGEINITTVLAASYLCITGPVLEELLCRGVLFILFLRLAGKWPAVILTSLIFAALHQIGMDGINWFMVSTHTISGLALCTVLLYTRRLRWCILMHSMWNTGVTLFLILVFALFLI